MPFMSETPEEICNYLSKIEGVYCINPGANSRWYVRSENTEHISELILKQKQPRQIQYRSFECKNTLNMSDCFFKDNIKYKYEPLFHPFLNIY